MMSMMEHDMIWYDRWWHDRSYEMMYDRVCNMIGICYAMLWYVDKLGMVWYGIIQQFELLLSVTITVARTQEVERIGHQVIHQ